MAAATTMAGWIITMATTTMAGARCTPARIKSEQPRIRAEIGCTKKIHPISLIF